MGTGTKSLFAVSSGRIADPHLAHTFYGVGHTVKKVSHYTDYDSFDILCCSNSPVRAEKHEYGVAQW